MNSLISEDGRVVPLILGIGNHKTLTGSYFKSDNFEHTNEWRQKNAPYFYSLFAFPGLPGYRVLDFGNYLSMVALDTDHTNPVDGQQSEWLEKILSMRKEVPHIFPFYHVPAYPSHRDPNGAVGVRVRENWVPLFEKYGVRAAFENHDHAYKRTYPIRNGKVDSRGITYIGDGAWGRGPRPGNSSNEWYIKKFAAEYHAVIVTIQGNHQHFLMVNDKGEVIDEYPQTPQRNK